MPYAGLIRGEQAVTLKIQAKSPKNQSQQAEKQEVIMAEAVEILKVKLPDGSVKEVPKGTTALDVARQLPLAGDRDGRRAGWAGRDELVGRRR